LARREIYSLCRRKDFNGTQIWTSIKIGEPVSQVRLRAVSCSQSEKRNICQEVSAIVAVLVVVAVVIDVVVVGSIL